MEDTYSLFRQHSGVWRSLRDGDFEEEEIWDIVRDRTDSSPRVSKSKENSYVPVPRSLPTAARMIPRVISNISNTSSNNSSHEAKVVQQSAPVNIPDWSNIYRNKPDKSSKNVSWIGNDADDDHDGVVNHGGYSDDDEEDEDDDGEFDYKLPPHEFIARRLARSHISSFSVFEGVGRTLKGRDLSKVRNAILTKTGFLESP
ncbi:Senescence regulator [Quillaja saponaria]|uniref:Senescence regulator n=1 Tax=Quillaja saponaria TaxID=32244 RepID=A0AAD7PM92_QUISA|nr:Senescence regulator [Quillaja saponaria]